MECLCKLKKIYKVILECESRLTEHAGLSLNEGMALCGLASGSRTSGELAQEIGLSPSRMSRILSSLENKALITRMMGKVDRRQMIFALTQKGDLKLDLINQVDKQIVDLITIMNEVQA